MKKILTTILMAAMVLSAAAADWITRPMAITNNITGALGIATGFPVTNSIIDLGETAGPFKSFSLTIKFNGVATVGNTNLFRAAVFKSQNKTLWSPAHYVDGMPNGTATIILDAVIPGDGFRYWQLRYLSLTNFGCSWTNQPSGYVTNITGEYTLMKDQYPLKLPPVVSPLFRFWATLGWASVTSQESNTWQWGPYMNHAFNDKVLGSGTNYSTAVDCTGFKTMEIYARACPIVLGTNSVKIFFAKSQNNGRFDESGDCITMSKAESMGIQQHAAPVWPETGVPGAHVFGYGYINIGDTPFIRPQRVVNYDPVAGYTNATVSFRLIK